MSRQIPENSDVCRLFNKICENKSEICRKFWILWKLFTIIQNYSLVSLGEPENAPTPALLDELADSRPPDDHRFSHTPPTDLHPSGPFKLIQVRWRRGTEPFELFTSEFGQNSVKIQCILQENSKNSRVTVFNIFENICEIPTKFHQNLSNNQWKEFKNNEFCKI